ncbi:MAG TPA: ADP-glyceromanno-heptose 6-epimerase [Cyclobacteriaceae bacterium]|nr:ADP-glyceromanno-heptose 6-epimerase [Cyclobacteriaceae bacterium]
MIVVTGASGFIGSRLIARLNRDNFKAIIAVDHFSDPRKISNLDDLILMDKIERTEFFAWIKKNQREIEFIFHIGARTDTTEFNRELLFDLNTRYSMEVWKLCVEYQIPLVYASSAATYGAGELGYIDDESIISRLAPLNPYGESKNLFDQWVIEREQRPFYWAGLKFFNVYGPHEDHKGRMASVIWHTFHKIRETGKATLFRSHNPKYKDGEQQRDFIFVDDVADVCIHLMHHRKNPGIYNLGTGKARTFLDLARSVFSAMKLPEKIDFIDTPIDIRDKYQYYTQASMSKLRAIGYSKSFTSLEDGVRSYVREYLLNK